ncbi:6807_t:CDS:1, partial [Dentiscutata erythropus]
MPYKALEFQKQVKLKDPKKMRNLGLFSEYEKITVGIVRQFESIVTD